jgi:hypothetical protein
MDLILQHRAIKAAMTHPLYEEASAHVYCQPVVFACQGEKLLSVKSRVTKIPSELDRCIVVSFLTSESIPKPLWGGGKSYDFILHPESMEILDASTGEWRS